MNTWYKLDNAGKLFPAVAKNINSSTYRVSVALTTKIDPVILQQALDTVIKRFPLLDVKLNRGIFWHYLTENENRILVNRESYYPCAPVNPSENNNFLMRVLYYESKISVEMFHALTDANGAFEFLKTLIYQYLYLLGEKVDDAEGVILPSGAFQSSFEIQNSFDAHYSSEEMEKQIDEAFHITGTPFEPYGHNVIHGSLSAGELNKVAKKHGTTITAYLTAVLIMAVYTSSASMNGKNAPIIISIPVNLRKMFSSKSLRNFFAVVNVGMKVLPETVLEDVIEEVTKQFKEKITKEYLSKIMGSNMKYEKNLFSRLTPIRLKEFAIRYGFNHLGDSTKTMTLTNIGNIKMPQSISNHIEAMETTIYPTFKSPVNCAVCSVNDRLTITFARNILESDVIQEFFSQLARNSHLTIDIISNDWGVLP